MPPARGERLRDGSAPPAQRCDLGSRIPAARPKGAGKLLAPSLLRW